MIDAEPDDEGVRALVGCGENLPDQQIVIVDPETLTACPAGRVGEIWVQGPSVAQGYWQQPETTERTFRARLKDTGEGPFLRTGDLGFLQDGELFVTGPSERPDHRPRRELLSAGHRADRAAEPSAAAARCGAAFTVEADGREQLVIVQEVERHKQSDFSGFSTAIRRAVAGEHELAPDAIVLIKAGSVPKTSSGKIQRHACRDGYLAGTLDVVGQWSAADDAGRSRAGRRAGRCPRRGTCGGDRASPSHRWRCLGSGGNCAGTTRPTIA